MEYKRYLNYELKEGMYVAIPRYLSWGWRNRYTKAEWNKKKIVRISPKRMSVWFGDGENMRIDAQGITPFYQWDEAMQTDTVMAREFERCYKAFDKLKDVTTEDISRLDPECVTRLNGLFCEANAILGVDK